MRGQFIRGDGLVIPNNVTRAGADMVLKAAFRHAVQPFYAALITGAPTLTLTQLNVVEPTIGTNGYARVELPQDDTGWPVLGSDGNQQYIESALMTWLPVGGNFDKPVQRLAILGFNTYSAAHDIFAVSELMPDEITLTPATDLALRQFKYRFYL